MSGVFVATAASLLFSQAIFLVEKLWNGGLIAVAEAAVAAAKKVLQKWN